MKKVLILLVAAIVYLGMQEKAFAYTTPPAVLTEDARRENLIQSLTPPPKVNHASTQNNPSTTPTPDLPTPTPKLIYVPKVVYVLVTPTPSLTPTATPSARPTRPPTKTQSHRTTTQGQSIFQQLAQFFQNFFQFFHRE
jgi:hypothetical protein